MIERLTDEQVAQIKVHRDLSLKCGLSTDPRPSETLLKDIVARVYAAAGFPPPKYFLWAKSPLQGIRMANVILEVPHKLDVEKDLQTQVEDFINSPEYANINKDYVEAFFGSMESPYLEFYNYFNKEGKKVLAQENPEYKEEWGTFVTHTEKLMPLYELCQNSGWVFTFPDVVILTDRPTELHFKGELCHNENGPAILYGDGFAVYSLNGIRVNKYIVETPVSEFDTSILLKEENAEIRREVVRKLGMVKVLEDLNAKVVDKKTVTISLDQSTIELLSESGIVTPSEPRVEEYELLNLEIRPGDFRPYLKMKNPSIGTYHIEGVGPECRTVDDALKFRAKKTDVKGNFVPPQILT